MTNGTTMTDDYGMKDQQMIERKHLVFTGGEKLAKKQIEHCMHGTRA